MSYIACDSPPERFAALTSPSNSPPASSTDLFQGRPLCQSACERLLGVGSRRVGLPFPHPSAHLCTNATYCMSGGTCANFPLPINLSDGQRQRERMGKEGRRRWGTERVCVSSGGVREERKVEGGEGGNGTEGVIKQLFRRRWHPHVSPPIYPHHVCVAA